jgi:hypothetical protein
MILLIGQKYELVSDPYDDKHVKDQDHRKLDHLVEEIWYVVT